MKRLTTLIFALMLLGALRPSVANVADVDWLAKFTAQGGATSESDRRKDAWGSGSHGLGFGELLTVIPITPFVGLQTQLNYQHLGDGSNHIGAQIGPVLSWGGGKVGVFAKDQFRIYGGNADKKKDGNFLWITPAVSLYDLFPATTIDISAAVPVSRKVSRVNGRFGDCCFRNIIAVSDIHAVVNWFPPIPVFGKDNLELSLGVQLLGYAGAEQRNVRDGIGPMAGVAFMPIPNLEVTLFKAAIDNQNRYRVTSGLSFYLHRQANASLLQLRRKYLEPTNSPGSATSFWH